MAPAGMAPTGMVPTAMPSAATPPSAAPGPDALPVPPRTAASLVRLGRIGYAEAWDLQKRLNQEQIDGARGPLVLFVEHPPTITIGRRGSNADVVAPAKVLERRGVAVTETDRGGQVTYHGPGQLVAYPMLELQSMKLGLHAYLRLLEESVGAYLRTLGLKPYIVDGRTGVWVGKEKACAMGIRVRRWWTMHGLALNVRTNLNHFGLIVPCGIRDRGVTSLEKLMGPDAAPTLEQAQDGLRDAMARILNLDLSDAPPESVLAPAAKPSVPDA